jgi:hypothetical protein
LITRGDNIVCPEDQEFEGSTALVAQRTRASDYGSEGWGFESLRARFVMSGQVLKGALARTKADVSVIPALVLAFLRTYLVTSVIDEL